MARSGIRILCSIITRDKVQVDYAGTCACGRPGPIILDTISRYSDANDDKVDCSGTFDAGVMEGH